MYQKKKRGFAPWVIGSAVLLLVSWLVLSLRDILTPFIVAAVLAYILNPLVEKLRDKGMQRGLASMLVTPVSSLWSRPFSTARSSIFR